MTTYSDLSFDFITDASGEFLKKDDLEAIKQSIYNIVLTRRGSRTIFDDPQFGSRVTDLLGEKMTPITSVLLQEEISSALNNYEPRINVLGVEAKADINDQSYNILISYEIIALQITDEFDINLKIIT